VNVLVLAPEPVSAKQLRDALGGPAGPEDAEVMVVAPALQDSPLKFWLSDADDAIAEAERVRSETLRNLGDAGIPASADTGESDPMSAIEDALRTFPAERVVLFTHPQDDQRYREDIDPDEVQRRFGLPVDRATV
jgi:hypothetical protein